jgi:hypothetical protein
LLPKIDTQVPGAIAAVRLAAFTTPFCVMAGNTGGACTTKITGIVCAVVVTPAR